MTDEGADDGESCLLGRPLNRGGDVADVVADARLLDPRGEGGLARAEQRLRLLGDLTDRARVCRVCDEAVPCDADEVQIAAG